jgi:hypothetical protein
VNGRTWTEVQWGVLYTQDAPFRPAGTVERGGTRPGGDIGPFNESHCRYIASHTPGAKVVRRVIVKSSTEFDWEQA